MGVPESNKEFIFEHGDYTVLARTCPVRDDINLRESGLLQETVYAGP